MKNKKLIILFLVMLLIGEISEIQYQTLSYGEYIKQYAIIYKVQQDYYDYCADCTCQLTVKDDKNKIIVNNKNMQQLDYGLFGYLAKVTEFSINKDYHSIFNCTSLTYGSGIVNAKFKIIEPIVNNTLGLTTSTESNDYSLFNIDEFVLKFKDMFIDLVGQTVNIVLGIFGLDWILKWFIDELGKPLYGIAIGLLHFFFNLLNLFILLLTNPSSFISDTLIPFVFGVLGYLFFAWIGINLLVEAIFIGYAVMTQRGILNVLSFWFMLHFKVIYYLFSGIIAGIKAFMEVLQSSLKIVSLLRQIFQI